MTQTTQASQAQLREQLAILHEQYDQLAAKKLDLDLTRGKPGTAQVALSSALDGILGGDYLAADGSDARNYGGLDGLPEARSLFGAMLGMRPEETLVGGNSSLTLMYQVVEFALREGLRGPESAWANHDEAKFLCPVPGYDRHFSICEYFGIDMLPVPLLDSGPDMDEVEALVAADPTIRGIWCVPRFSNPTGCVYSAATVERLARLPQQASSEFIVMWDNAYAVHELYDDAPQLAPISDYARQFDTMDNIFQFGSTSKITFAGAGVAFVGSSERNLATLKAHLAFQTIGPDKVNQLRHVRFLQDPVTIAAHMEHHAALMRPRFEAVLTTLEQELGDGDMGCWTRPRGGYFISFDALPGLAGEIVGLAARIGVKLTPAGATFPYGRDPEDRNIRLSPSFPSLEDVQASVDAFVLCVKIATLQQRLHA
ncbi:aminotransferase class I/II-fold pyridoxal phosphate-dependent enzyme [Kineobactrum salinum]|uniref:Aminotransferase class I/II-fold pyridoxal phosphate-dependent enzyme n=1 Tax=Kineobactrum salinum TaxID=2708301 RepID=A0A6C0TY89_9GAMM|nr:aminotransferase class I/II-fold pyridoxal phosphate-dependent enzyme [Kineobactrum salinum]QIB64802.1 aminotransferase class I/II-fold pyridoxal phosphate-dependent enzyme [Kineobactrum salinum]